jgi:hypothetical protein
MLRRISDLAAIREMAPVLELDRRIEGDGPAGGSLHDGGPSEALEIFRIGRWLSVSLA